MWGKEDSRRFLWRAEHRRIRKNIACFGRLEVYDEEVKCCDKSEECKINIVK